MKKFLVILLMLFSILICACVESNSIYANASEHEYMRVIDHNTPFYPHQTAKEPLFYLPYTYYVKILSVNDTFAHVECFVSNNTPSIDGYVPLGTLFSDGLTVISPYVNVDIKTLHTTVLYHDSNLTSPMQYVFAERNMRYYGALPTSNGIIYYVEYNDKLGYVKESDVYPFSIPNHPNELTFIQPEEPPKEEDKEQITLDGENSFSLKIIIVGCLLFAGIIALFVALKRHPRPSIAASYYDDNDYE